MTRKDYIVIAAAINKAMISSEDRDTVAETMARALWDADTTQRFDSDRFLKAAGHSIAVTCPSCGRDDMPLGACTSDDCPSNNGGK